MPYVRGHGRRVGWVVGHHRRPHGAGSEQLPLAEAPDAAAGEQPKPSSAAPMVPAPRVSPEGAGQVMPASVGS